MERDGQEVKWRYARLDDMADVNVLLARLLRSCLDHDVFRPCVRSGSSKLFFVGDVLVGALLLRKTRECPMFVEAMVANAGLSWCHDLMREMEKELLSQMRLVGVRTVTALAHVKEEDGSILYDASYLLADVHGTGWKKVAFSKMNDEPCWVLVLHHEVPIRDDDWQN